MRVFNIREGHACNSSSTHSVVLLAPDAKDHNLPVVGTEWGWEWFVAASLEAKKDYFDCQLYENLKNYCGGENAERLIRVMGGRPKMGHDTERCIDHQSVWTLPRSHRTKFLDLRFATALQKELLKHPSLGIRGGNDNFSEDTPPQPLPGVVRDLRCLLPTELARPRALVCREDKAGYWVVLDQDTGRRLRVQFSDQLLSEVRPQHSHTPELVDINITNRCTLQCFACFRDSKPDGTHAEVQTIYKLLYDLSRGGVLEVAIGGGEPLLHPYLVDILATARERDIVPNLTTRAPDLIVGSGQRSIDIVRLCGSIACSATSESDVDRAHMLDEWIEGLRRQNADPEKQDCLAAYLYPDGHFAHVVVQIPMGTLPREEFHKVMRRCEDKLLPVTCLGYKATGRAAPEPRYPYFEWWLDDARRYCNRIGVDTTLAAEFRDALLILPENQRRITWEEGQFSCYADAVDGVVRCSSYAPATDPHLTFDDMRWKWDEAIPLLHALEQKG